MFEKYLKNLENSLVVGINEALGVLEKDIENKSPVDTGDYISWNKRDSAKREWDKVVGSVFNDSKNATNVEFGWRKTEVNRHKNRKQWWPVIYRGVGARVYTRSLDENESKVRKILEDNIKKWT